MWKKWKKSYHIRCEICKTLHIDANFKRYTTFWLKNFHNKIFPKPYYIRCPNNRLGSIFDLKQFSDITSGANIRNFIQKFYLKNPVKENKNKKLQITSHQARNFRENLKTESCARFMHFWLKHNELKFIRIYNILSYILYFIKIFISIFYRTF